MKEEALEFNERLFEIRSSGVTLAGTMTTPLGKGPFPTALLVAGSGEIDRDANHKKIKLNLSRDLARILADTGWASVRFDKRGVGASGGDYLSTGWYDELADIEAIYCWTEAQPEVGLKILIGHSAGAMQTAQLASGEPTFAGGVLLATSAKTGEETLAWQAREIQDLLVPGAVKGILKLFGTSVTRQQAKTMKRLRATTTDTVRIQLVRINAKWMREFMAYDPKPALREARVPLLAITGSKDIQADPTDLEIVADLAEDCVTHLVEDVDHLLRHEPAQVSNPKKYANQAEKPIDPRVTAALLDWLKDIRAAQSEGAS